MSITTRALTLEDLPPPPPGKTGWPWTEQSELLPDRMPNDYEWPRISIVTPNYNYSHFLEETIRSVLLQGYPNLEYIITDGGSTDGSLEVIKKYAQWLAYYVSEKDRGQSDAINKGFSKATGKIYAWLNSDDVFCQNTLSEIGQFWSNNSNCYFLTGDGYFFLNDKRIEKIEYYIKAQNYSFQDLMEYHYDKYLPQPSVFFSQESFHKLSGLDVSLSYAMDLDFWLRLRLLYNLYYIPKCFSKLRHHTDAKTWKSNVNAMAEVIVVIEKYYKYLKPSVKFKNQLALRLFYALSMFRRALLEHSNGNKLDSIIWLYKSISFCPIMICFAKTWKLIIKILFIKPKFEA
jgi:glycosyltransferase involved in cell wall biosynthesis